VVTLTDTQLYLAVGLPTLAVLIGVLINAMQFNAQFSTLNARITTLESSLTGRITALENHVANFEARMDSRLEIILGKLIEVDNRVSRLEDHRR
jgi:predicted PurR-regulated permease PerM